MAYETPKSSKTDRAAMFRAVTRIRGSALVYYGALEFHFFADLDRRFHCVSTLLLIGKWSTGSDDV